MKELIYKVIDLFTFGKGIQRIISGFKLRIPTRYYKYFEPDYELNNINFINNTVTPGMTIVDVGGHIGLLSVILARKTGPQGKVLAFEPTPSTFRLLQKTLSINQVESIVRPLSMAVSEKSGETTFYITDIEAHNSNSLANNKRHHGNVEGIKVKLVAIDELLTEHKLSKIDFIKIDAEGAEYSVLKGASGVMDKFHPKIILALHPSSIQTFGDSLAEIWDFVVSKKYRVLYKNDFIDKETFVRQGDLFDVFLI